MIKRDDEITIVHDYPHNFHSVTFGYGGLNSVTIENRDGVVRIFSSRNEEDTAREFTGLFLDEFLRAIGVEMVIPTWALKQGM